MCYSLHDIEKKQNISLPGRYKQLYQSNFRDIDGKSIVRTNEEEFHIKRFLTVTEIIYALDEFYDLALENPDDAISFLSDSLENFEMKIE